ncbi:MAG: L-glutamate gamma-semialdehyde dehydrogenase [Gracilimonas sp.]|uniref:L-glutamate gamma-semialdehyde dehydrogenase n=1 Tax=Gracilimonas TaxID=649462 RepID=UPI001AFD12A3|nr:L-glutamate gamma-semialdehyde dehydrogenase [Gracilimonas sp.]MBO6585428.1 L-glutamate gamma-semialdehyde dehydrogenase [Gracilimonas sp.]MBO6616424.1 L-glutamate gamma-semialdehyde dehydrogenase [Gracilimonas sp.]
MPDQTLEKYKNETYLDFSDPTNDKAQKKALEEVRSDFGQEYDLYINGEFVKGDAGTFESKNPSNLSETIGTFQMASKDQAFDALEKAWDAFESWQYVSAEKRAEYLFKAADVVRRRRLEINAWMISEAGKSYLEADADTCEAIDFIEYYAHEALRIDDGMDVLSETWGDYNKTIYMPIGAGISISPWNFPFAIFVGMAVAPIAVGNTVVAKPAPDTPRMGSILTEIFEEVGLPKGVFNFVTGGDIEVGENLAKHPKTRFISFTGSKAVGLHLNKIAAEVADGQKFLKRMVCELGGKNATVVDADADIEKASTEIVKGAFGFQGQKCSASSRVIAHQDIYDELLERVAEKTKALSVGDAKENHIAGPVINQKAVDKIMSYIEIGKKEGRLVAGGKRAETENEGYYIEPTVFADISEDDRIAQEEIFGPVTAFIKAKDTDDALRIANGVDYGLTGAYFSQDPKKIDRALREYRVGNLYINRKCTGALVGAQPFGGFKLSGTDAKAGGRDYLKYFLEPKSTTLRPADGVDYELEDFEFANK